MRTLSLGTRWAVTIIAVALTAAPAAAQAPAPARLLVLLRNASALAVVDPVSLKELGRVGVVRDPHEVTVSPDGRTAYVGSPSEGISVVDLPSLKELRRVDPGLRSAPHDVQFVGGKVYFTAEGWKSIGAYDPVGGKVEWMLGVGQNGSHMLVFSKDGNTVYVPNRGSNTVSVVENITAGPPKYQISAIPVQGKTPEGTDLTPDGTQLWVVTRGDGGLTIIDLATRTVVQRMELKLVDANRLKFTPDGKRALILDGGDGTIHVLDVASRKEIKVIKAAPGDSGDGGMLVMTDNSRAYFGLRDTHSVAVLDLATLEVTRRIDMGPNSGPGCIAWTQPQ